MNQKRGATLKAPYIGRCKLRFAETDKPSYVLVSRDDAMVFFRLRGELAGTRRLGKEEKGGKSCKFDGKFVSLQR